MRKVNTSQSSNLTRHRSPLKWAGGKYHLLDHLIPHLNPNKRLVEPFAGSAVVLLNTDYQRYWLNDINPDLIGFYQQLKLLGEDFITKCQRYFTNHYNNSTKYYQLRKKFNHCQKQPEKASLFLYLNRHGYNGLCRYNKKGIFNVPFGRYQKPYFPEQEMLHLQQKLQRTKLTNLPFTNVIQKAKSSDTIYCDPPYYPLNKTAYFTQYHKASFTEPHQRLLAELAQQAQEKQIITVISNHDTPITRQLYQAAKLKHFEVRRKISCKQRNLTKELLAIF